MCEAGDEGVDFLIHPVEDLSVVEEHGMLYHNGVAEMDSPAGFLRVQNRQQESKIK
jgi:hypothetical protein